MQVVFFVLVQHSKATSFLMLVACGSARPPYIWPSPKCGECHQMSGFFLGGSRVDKESPLLEQSPMRGLFGFPLGAVPTCTLRSL